MNYIVCYRFGSKREDFPLQPICFHVQNEIMLDLAGFVSLVLAIYSADVYTRASGHSLAWQSAKRLQQLRREPSSPSSQGSLDAPLASRGASSEHPI